MSTELIWECIKTNSSFIKKQKNMPVFSAESDNLCGLNSMKYSGLANKKVLGLKSVKNGKKEGIQLVRSSPKEETAFLPEKRTNATGIHKYSKKGLAAIDKLMADKLYRKDLIKLVKEKYVKIKKSFKKKKKIVKSRRSPKA